MYNMEEIITGEYLLSGSDEDEDKLLNPMENVFWIKGKGSFLIQMMNEMEPMKN